MLMPVIGTLGTISTYAMWIGLRYYAIPRYYPRFRKVLDKPKALERVYSMFGTMLTATYTLVISTAFGPFDCTKQANSTRYVMTQNSSQYCFESEWQKNFPFALLFLLSYALFVPFGLAIRFFLQRNNIDDQLFQTRFRQLINSYRREYYFWELVTMMKRASIFVTIQLSSNVYPSTRFFIILLLLLFFFGNDIAFMPYATKYLNSLSSL
jgi:hypothetical protein